MSNFDGESVLEFAVSLAKSAGKLILEGSQKRSAAPDADWESILKKNTADLVTETDQATEAHVKREISAKYPSHKFIGEESWAAGEEPEINDEPTWIVDPIDGTTNFVKGFPFACISIGVTYKGKAVIGVVYNPFLDYLYTALVGKGAFRQTAQDASPRRLPLSPPLPLPSLRQAVVAVEWGSDRKKETIDKKTRSFAKLCGSEEEGVEGGRFVQGVRSLGSAALSCCCVAEGSLDLWQEVGCWSWDVTAGAVIVAEAGGAVVGGKVSALTSLGGKENFNVLDGTLLQGRKYLVIRAIGDTPKEPARQAQERIIKEFYEAIEDWEAV